MAYSSTNGVSVGTKTKKSHYDQLLDNTIFLHTNILGVSGDGGTSIAPTAFTLNYVFKTTASNGLLALAGSDNADNPTDSNGARIIVYGETHSENGAILMEVGGGGVGTPTNTRYEFRWNDDSVVTILASWTLTAAAFGVPISAIDSASNLTLWGSSSGITGGSSIVLQDDSVGDGDMLLYAGTGNLFRFFDGPGSDEFVRLAVDSSSDGSTGATLTVYDGAAAVSTLDILCAKTRIGDASSHYVEIDGDGGSQSVKSTDALTIRSGIGSLDVLTLEATYVVIPVKTDAGAPAGSTANSLIYNTNENKLYFYNGGWKSAAFA